MHTITETVASTRSAVDPALVRVAVAGATGYAGQELLRLLARHPYVSVGRRHVIWVRLGHA